MQVTNIPLDADNRESTQHGDLGFPIAMYYSIMSKNVLGYTPLHWHDAMQFCAVVKGNIRFHVKEKEYFLETGDGIFVNSGCLHMAKPEGDPDSTYICMDFEPPMLASFSGSAVEQQYLLPALTDPELESVCLRQSVPWQAEILSEIHASYACYTGQQPYYELETTIRLQQMFLLLLRHQPHGAGGHKKSRSNAVVQRIISYMGQHYGEKITLEDIADDASYTRSECCRVFKKFTGESIFSYLRSFRLERSTYMLQNTDQSVSDIAYACGFSSTSYYIEAFRAQFDMTPRQYRQVNA